ncbi:MAG: nucleoside diphosphate kinase regulator [Idiomarina sp.]|nr:nucleoside diphosphate kinase regulator [Idiomarina sp.]
MSAQPDIILSSYDVDNIERWIEKSKLPAEIIDGLETELARATIVKHADLPSDRVAMGSQVTFKITELNKTFSKTLCYPNDVAEHEDALSIFAPVGSALIGLAVGQSIEWPGQRGVQHVEIIDVQHQQRVSKTG